MWKDLRLLLPKHYSPRMGRIWLDDRAINDVREVRQSGAWYEYEAQQEWYMAIVCIAILRVSKSFQCFVLSSARYKFL